MSDLVNTLSDREFDNRLEVATQMLKQAADEEGIDLDDYDQEEIADMLGDLVENNADNDNGEGGDGEGKTAGDITYADVSFELAKRAAAEGVDLSELDASEYNEVFNKVAADMTDPDFAKVAAQEAHMDELGRIAARGFVDEINKLASDEDDDDDDDKEKKKVAAAKSLLSRARKGVSRAGDYLKEKGRSAGKSERKFHKGLGERVGKALGIKNKGTANAQRKKSINIGRATTGGGLATAGGAGYGGKKLYDRRDD